VVRWSVVPGSERSVAMGGVDLEIDRRRRVEPVIGALTGLTPAAFGALATELDTTWRSVRFERLAERPRRMRAPGAGRPPIALAARLLLGLARMRWGGSYRATAAVFGVSKDTVHRVEVEVHELLTRAGRARWEPPAPAEPLATVVATLGDGAVRDAFVVLGTLPGGGETTR
jgi:hypothetical protein